MIVTVSLDLEAVIDLCNCQMEWSSVDWAKQEKRFTTLGLPIQFGHKYIYWFDSGTAADIAQTVLIGAGYSTQRMIDTVTEEYVITTDYAGSWAEVA